MARVVDRLVEELNLINSMEHIVAAWTAVAGDIGHPSERGVEGAIPLNTAARPPKADETPGDLPPLIRIKTVRSKPCSADTQ